MRTRFLPKLVSREVAAYLERNDLIFVPVGTVEMHGGLPLECETTISEAFALKMAEKCDAIVLNNLPYFYAGATASSVGTTQVSIQEGIRYLTAIAKSLLRQGFKRQVYLSFHGPAHMTCSPMVRDFYDETGNPILYLDFIMLIMKHAKDFFHSPASFDAIIFGAYDILGRLEEIPLAHELDFDPSEENPNTTTFANALFELAYQSGSIGYYFSEETDHMSTPKVETALERQQLADEGKSIIEGLVSKINYEELLQTYDNLVEFNQTVCATHPCAPANGHYKK